MWWLKWLVIGLATLALLVLAAGQLGWLAGPAPQRLGAVNGQLQPPSRTPNSVSSQADLWPDHPQREYARIEPFPIRGDAAATLAALREAALALPGAELVRAEDNHLYLRFTTRWMKFVDDLEFWADPAAGVVHVRSASRVGRKDFGVNRARVEAIRRRLN
jgi:uncharacterized protein (DUF1499 family)